MDRINLFSIFARALVLVTCIPIHEFAHGWVAYRLGDTTARDQGRLTLNPFAHLNFMGTLLLLLVGFGWANPVPINSSRFKGNPRYGMMLTAIAGPAANLVLAFVLLILYKVLFALVVAMGLWKYSFLSAFFLILEIMVSTNVVLAVFNLIPIYPLDGSHILEFLLPQRAAAFMWRYEKYFYGLLFLLLIFGLLDRPLNWLTNIILRILDQGTSFIDVIAQLIMRW